MWNMKSESPLNLIFNSRSLSLQARVGPFIRSFNFLLESGTHGFYYSNPDHFKTWTAFKPTFQLPISIP
jgi:hypothetical protein